MKGINDGGGVFGFGHGLCEIGGMLFCKESRCGAWTAPSRGRILASEVILYNIGQLSEIFEESKSKGSIDLVALPFAGKAVDHGVES